MTGDEVFCVCFLKEEEEESRRAQPLGAHQVGRLYFISNDCRPCSEESSQLRACAPLRIRRIISYVGDGGDGGGERRVKVAKVCAPSELAGGDEIWSDEPPSRPPSSWTNQGASAPAN